MPDSDLYLKAWMILVQIPTLHERGGLPLSWFKQRKLNKAKKLLRPKGANLDSEDIRYLWALAHVHHMENEVEEAYVIFQAMKLSAMPDPLLLYEKSQVEMALGHVVDAEQSARQAVDLDPDNVEFKVHYALSLMLCDEAKRAFGVIANVYKKYPESARARLVLERIKVVMRDGTSPPAKLDALGLSRGEF